MLEKEQSSAYFLLKKNVISFFNELSSCPMRYVVVGDAQENFKLSLDAGCFVAGLEYVTESKAIVIGKAEQNFFSSSLRVYGC